MNKTELIAVIALIIIAITAFHIGYVREAAINATARCIHETAQREGYAGDPYSKDAWQRFAGDCKQ